VPADLRTHAALALASAGDVVAVPALIELLGRCAEEVELCRQAILALGDLGDAQGAAALRARLGEVHNRRETVTALGLLRDELAVPALVACLLEDAYVPVRAEAAHALARIGGRRARQALRSASRSEREAVVRAAIDAALRAPR
jgi:HEAT repeat protein